MDACNSGLRSFNRQVAQSVIEIARANQLSTIIELGAGRAPVTAELVKREDAAGLRLVTCDLVPNVEAYKKLAQQYPDKVFPIYSPVDLTQPQVALNDSVLVLAVMMHHIPFELRPAVLQMISETNSRAAIFEPLLRTWRSIFFATVSFFPAILLPITFFRRPGKLRRFLWCWIIPIVPYMFVWDGITSCLRQWTRAEWQEAFDNLENPPKVEYQQGFNSLRIFWGGTGNGSKKPIR